MKRGLGKAGGGDTDCSTFLFRGGGGVGGGCFVLVGLLGLLDVEFFFGFGHGE